MKEIIESSFVKMCKQGILGAILGIISGLLLGTCIYFLQFPLVWLSTMTAIDGKGEFIYSYLMWQNAAQPGMLGASVGAVLGAIFGSIFGLKQYSKK